MSTAPRGRFLRFCRRRGAVLCLLLFAFPVGAEESQPLDLESGIRQLVEELAPRMKENGVRKVAVLPFPDLNGYPTALGDFLAEELITNLFLVSPSEFSVVERSQLARVLEEQKLSFSGLLDTETIAEVGKILGIEGIVTGSIGYLGETIKINARVVSVQTARVSAAAAVTVANAGAVKALSSQRSSSATGSGRPFGAPAQVQRHDVFFLNSFLRADVVSIGVSQERRAVSLSLDLSNVSTEPVLIALDRGSTDCRASLVSDRGDAFRAPRVSAGAVGIPCLYDDAEEGKFALLSPGSRTSLVLTFPASDRVRRSERSDLSPGIKGRYFSFAGEFLRLKDGKIQGFSVGIGNIEAPEVPDEE